MLIVTQTDPHHCMIISFPPRLVGLAGCVRRLVCGFAGILLLAPAASPALVLSVPQIVQQPTNQMVWEGQSATFVVTVDGSPFPAIRWFKNGVMIPGATGNALAFGNSTLALEGTYTAMASNLMGRVFSNPVTLTVRTPPQFVTQPDDLVAVLGTKVRLAATVAGSSPLHYQWFKNGQVVNGAVQSSLVFENVQVTDAGLYWVTTGNPYGTNTSQAVLLDVLTPPSILVHPASITRSVDQNLSLCVTAAGSDPFHYQWRKNGVNLPGFTNSCLAIDRVQPDDGGTYSVVVLNAAGAVESLPARVLIDVQKIGSMDDFIDRVPLGNEVSRGNNEGASKETGEPDHAGSPGGRSVWYTLSPNDNGIVTVQTQGSTFDTLLAVYTGDDLQTLELLAQDEDRGGFFSSSVQFRVEAGNQYPIAVDGFDGAAGDFIISWELEVTDDLLPVIGEPPQSATVPDGAPHQFEVTATGDHLEYFWFFNGSFIPGETSEVLTIGQVNREHVGTYWVVVLNDFGRPLTSPAVTLEIGPEASVQTLDKISIQGNASPLNGPKGMVTGVMSVVSGGGVGLPVAPGTIVSQVLNNTNSVTQAGEPNHCGTLGSSTRWMVLTSTQPGLEFIVDTIGSDIPTVLAVYSRASVIDPLVEVTCDAAVDATDIASLVGFSADPELDYWIAVDGFEGAEGVIQLNWRLGQPPTVMAHPTATTSALLSDQYWGVLLQQGIPPPTVQWQQNGGDLANATNLVFSISDAQAADAGNYSIVASNFMGELSVHVAALTVDPTLIVLEESTYEPDAQEWEVAVGSGLDSPFHVPSFGLEDGFVQFTDDVNPEAWFWSAPSEFLGNQSGAHGGRLEFERFKSPTSSEVDDLDVVLSGGGLVLVADLPNPGPDWTHQILDFIEGGPWRLDELAGASATQADLLRVLQSLDALLIRGDFSPEAHQSGLDNVRLIGPVSSDVVVLEARHGADAQVTLRWPDAGAAFQLERATDLNLLDWVSLSDVPAIVDGFRQVTVSGMDAARFYRLRRP